LVFFLSRKGKKIGVKIKKMSFEGDPSSTFYSREIFSVPKVEKLKNQKKLESLKTKLSGLFLFKPFFFGFFYFSPFIFGFFLIAQR